uniref:S-adenosyl-L-homocysteine hydrolase NAD binding domain-containing protein n=1 Tax=Bionectria ochroleuca TaxID=29856 RepID=A0A0B7K6P4_BIOOC
MSRPKVMLLGTLEHAQDAWSSLAPIADSIRPKSRNRADFIKEAKSGAFDGVVALYRDYYSVTVSGRFDAELLDAMPRSFKYICHNGAGYDQIDVAACTERGIHVSHTPGAVNESTADLAIWLAVGALRNLSVSVHSCHAGAWRGKPAPALGHDPQGKTMGILGFGGIGRTVAQRAMAFGMTVKFYDPFPVDPKLHGGAHSVSLDALLKESDIISIHIPLTPDTHHFISTAEFEKMKDGVVVVNTARGPILDEAALVKALASGKVASAGLDVFEKEPEINPGLLANKKVLLVPHMGTWSVETQTKMEVLAIDNVRSAVTKSKLITQVPEQRSIAKL